MYLFNSNGPENRATSFSVFKHVRPTVQFMYSAANTHKAAVKQADI
jgi:hypothetical protein